MKTDADKGQTDGKTDPDKGKPAVRDSVATPARNLPAARESAPVINLCAETSAACSSTCSSGGVVTAVLPQPSSAIVEPADLEVKANSLRHYLPVPYDNFAQEVSDRVMRDRAGLPRRQTVYGPEIDQHVAQVRALAKQAAKRVLQRGIMDGLSGLRRPYGSWPSDFAPEPFFLSDADAWSEVSEGADGSSCSSEDPEPPQQPPSGGGGGSGSADPAPVFDPTDYGPPVDVADSPPDAPASQAFPNPWDEGVPPAPCTEAEESQLL